MKDLRFFDIDIVGLSANTHHYDYQIRDSFFALFDNALLEKGNFEIALDLEKTSTMLIANFQIDGTVELTCDRSLEEFDYPINTQGRFIFKFGETQQELDDNILMIPFGATQINVAQPIYEMIISEVPMKRLHPRFWDEEEHEEDEQETILFYSSATDQDEEQPEDQEDDNPIWDALKKLRK